MKCSADSQVTCRFRFAPACLLEMSTRDSLILVSGALLYRTHPDYKHYLQSFSVQNSTFLHILLFRDNRKLFTAPAQQHASEADYGLIVLH